MLVLRIAGALGLVACSLASGPARAASASHPHAPLACAIPWSGRSALLRAGAGRTRWLYRRPSPRPRASARPTCRAPTSFPPPAATARGDAIIGVNAYPNAEADSAAYRLQFAHFRGTNASGCFKRVAQDGTHQLNARRRAGLQRGQRHRRARPAAGERHLPRLQAPARGGDQRPASANFADRRADGLLASRRLRPSPSAGAAARAPPTGSTLRCFSQYGNGVLITTTSSG